MLNNKPIDNSSLVIPFYDTIPAAAQFPCDTERLKYNKENHRYYLTEAALSYYEIDYEPQQAKWLIRKATEHIYSYIQIMSQTKYNLMCYRIAKSLFGSHKSHIEGRRELEEKLALQAEFIANYGDAKNTPKLVVNPETGRMKEQDVNMSTGYWLHDEVLNWLDANHLTDANAIYNTWQVDWSTY